MPSYPPIRVTVTLKINLPRLSEGGKEKILCRLSPPIRVTVTFKINLPPLTDGGKKEIVPSYPLSE
jgi:hypothetical protein